MLSDRLFRGVVGATTLVVALAAGCGGFERGEPEPTGPAAPGGDGGGGGGGDGAAVTFATNVQPVLMSRCGGCHRSGGVAASTRFVLTGDATTDRATVTALVDPASPPSSLLLVKATGQAGHGGGAVLSTSSPEYQTLLEWVSQGAP